MSLALKNALRRSKREQRIPPDARCLICGTAEPVCLINIDRRFLEKHHLYGCVNDPTAIVWLCRNHHALATEGLLAAGVNMSYEPDPVQREILMLKAEATFFRQLAESHDRRAAELEASQ